MKIRIELDFLVDLKEIEKRAEVPDSVRIIFTDPDKIFLTGCFGESGRKMVEAGIPFHFTRRLAEKYIKWGIAKKADTKEEEKKKSELKPCPFCGGNNLKFRNSGCGWAIWCMDCGGRIENCFSKEKMTREWNRRA